MSHLQETDGLFLVHPVVNPTENLIKENATPACITNLYPESR